MTNDYVDFVRSFKIPDSVEGCMEMLETVIGYCQYVGELVNEAEAEYKKKYGNCLSDLAGRDEETEISRKAKLESWTADAKRDWKNMGVLSHSLNDIRIILMQAVTTKRQSPTSRYNP